MGPLELSRAEPGLKVQVSLQALPSCCCTMSLVDAYQRSVMSPVVRQTSATPDEGPRKDVVDIPTALQGQRDKMESAQPMDSGLIEKLQAALQHSDLATVELISMKLLALAKRRDRDGILHCNPSAQLANDSYSSIDSSALSDDSTAKGSNLGSTDDNSIVPIKFSPYVATVRMDSTGHLTCEMLPSGVPDRIFDPSESFKQDAARLLTMLDPLLREGSERSKMSLMTEILTENCPILTQCSQGVNLTEMFDMIMKVSQHASELVSNEPRLLDISSPCQVLGDLHGNVVDLAFFKRCLWSAGPTCAVGNFLFLGDFVDRGPDSIVVVAYIMALKVLEPTKFWMIRGNHETREVNGNIQHYAEGSFLWQCRDVFGESKGDVLWEFVNKFFDTLPLAAQIDHSIFCVHGGIPKELCEPGASLSMISQVPSKLLVACPFNPTPQSEPYARRSIPALSDITEFSHPQSYLPHAEAGRWWCRCLARYAMHTGCRWCMTCCGQTRRRRIRKPMKSWTPKGESKPET
jgi:hypothetical protein